MKEFAVNSQAGSECTGYNNSAAKKIIQNGGSKTTMKVLIVQGINSFGTNQGKALAAEGIDVSVAGINLISPKRIRRPGMIHRVYNTHNYGRGGGTGRL